jgi:formylglycine-generating enzyme required for sulfatase activity
MKTILRRSFGWLALLVLLAPGVALAQASFKDCAHCPEMVKIPAGSFVMGSSGQTDAVAAAAGVKTAGDEEPSRKVTIAAFAIGKYEVTQAQWLAVMGHNPSSVKGDDLPVESVSWNDVQAFIQKLNARTGKHYRLPTEAEWEYAARAGSGALYFFGNDPAQLDRYAWFAANAGGGTHPVGQKQPNRFGLYDVYGNVWEWVQDCYRRSYAGAPANGTAISGAKSCDRVDRGGAFVSSPGNLRSANRDWGQPNYRLNNLGFRLARSLP